MSPACARKRKKRGWRQVVLLSLLLNILKNMPKAKNKNQTKSKLALAAVGAGVAVLAAGAAGSYFLQTAKNRKKLKGWMLKMKGETLEKIEKLKEVNEKAYHKAVDAAAKRYVA